MIRDERAQVVEQQMYREVFGVIEELEDAASHFGDSYMSLHTGFDEVLELYHGHFASSASPMGRFTTISPANDSHPWLAREAMEEAGVGYGDLETIEVRKLASELVAAEGESMRIRVNEGSPQPSSDTLSISELRKVRTTKKGPRVRKPIMLRKRGSKRPVAAQAGGEGSMKVGVSEGSTEK